LALAASCRRHGIRKLSLFGSELKGTARPDSDIDLLVDFEDSARPSLFDMAQIEIELSALLGGRRADLRTAAELTRIFHQDAELWRRTGRDRSGSTGAANRSFYWQDGHARYGRPGPARIRPEFEWPQIQFGRKSNGLRLAAQTHLPANGGGLVKYPG